MTLVVGAYGTVAVAMFVGMMTCFYPPDFRSGARLRHHIAVGAFAAVCWLPMLLATLGMLWWLDVERWWRVRHTVPPL